jgi:hypothetical protein
MLTTTSMPLVNYRFGCNSNGAAQVNSDPWLGSLIPSDEPLGCHFSNNGVTSATLMESNATVALLREEFLQTNATGLVLEAWMTPTSEDDTDLSKSILSIGGRHEKAEGCQGMELYLGQRGNLLEIRYSDNDAAQTCRILLVKQQPMIPNELLQVVLVLNQGETSIYFNGVPIISGARNELKTNLTTWNPDYTLQLFSNHLESSHYAGSIHQVSMYNQAMDVDQVSSIYERGLERLNKQRVEREPLKLVAHVETASLVQGQASSFTIGGYNASTPDWVVLVEITTLPQFGNLLADDGPVNVPGYRIPLLGDATRTSLFYRAWSEDYFNVPCFSYSGQDLEKPPEFFSYRLIAVDAQDNEKVLGLSESVQHDLVIVHINHPPTLLTPNKANVPPEQPSGLDARPMAFVEGLELKDPDQNMDRVRVDIWTYNGTLTIPEDYLRLADFETCANRSPFWQCHGTGAANRNMTFVTEPDDASLILSNLQYNAFFWDQEDSIVVRIYDGSGGPCLKEEEHQVRFSTNDNFFDDNAKVYHTIHDECYELMTSIQVPAVARNRVGEISHGKVFFQGLFEVDDFGIADVIFWAVIGMLVLACCFSIQTCIKCLGRRGRKVYPDDVNYGSQNTSGANNV